MDTRKLLLGIAMAAVVSGTPHAWAQSTVAKLEDVSGNVLVSRETGMTTAAEGDRILSGSRIITTARSRTVVVFDTGCRVEMEENQRLDVDSRKPCAALLPLALGVAPALVAVPLAGYVVPGLILGGAILGTGDSGGPTPVSPN